MVMMGAELLKSKPPKWDPNGGTVDYYYWYYGTYAMARVGGAYWQAWRGDLIKALMHQQIHKGCPMGSWPPEYGPWGDAGGRIYATALSTPTKLKLKFVYLPYFLKPIFLMLVPDFHFISV